MKLSKIEQEIIINFNEGEKDASVFTHNKALIRKLDKYCEKRPDLFRIEKDDDYEKWGCKTYLVPKKFLGIRLPRELSEEQLEKTRENLKVARENKSQLPL